MTIIRTAHDKEHPYVMVTRGVAQNHTLSYEALGLLTYLLSKPDDWTVVPETLTRPGCRRDKVYKLLNELKDAGHITHERVEAAHNVPPMWGERIVNEAPLTPIPEMPEMATEQAAKAPEPLPFTLLPDTAIAGYGERRIRKNDGNKPESKDNKQENKQNTQDARAHTRGAFDGVPESDRLAIIHAWSENLSISPVNPYTKTRNHKAAAEIFHAGYRAPQVALFVKAKMQDTYWIGKTLTLENVGALMPKFLLDYGKAQQNGNHVRAAPNGNGAHAPPAAPSTSEGFIGMKARHEAEQAAKQGGK